MGGGVAWFSQQEFAWCVRNCVSSCTPHPFYLMGSTCMYFYKIHCSMGLIKRAMENGVKREKKQRFGGKQNKWILLIQLLTKENNLKQNKTLILVKILNPQLYISIFEPHWCSQSKGSLKWKPFVIRDILVNEFSAIKKIRLWWSSN